MSRAFCIIIIASQVLIGGCDYFDSPARQEPAKQEKELSPPAVETGLPTGTETPVQTVEQQRLELQRELEAVAQDRAELEQKRADIRSEREILQQLLQETEAELQRKETEVQKLETGRNLDG